jgi:hypothetical protein
MSPGRGSTTRQTDWLTVSCNVTLTLTRSIKAGVHNAAGGNRSPRRTCRRQERGHKRGKNKAVEVRWDHVLIPLSLSEAAAEHYWTAREDTHLLAFLQGQAANTLRRALTRAVYGNAVEALHCRYGENYNPDVESWQQCEIYLFLSYLSQLYCGL